MLSGRTRTSVPFVMDSMSVHLHSQVEVGRPKGTPAGGGVGFPETISYYVMLVHGKVYPEKRHHPDPGKVAKTDPDQKRL